MNSIFTKINRNLNEAGKTAKKAIDGDVDDKVITVYAIHVRTSLEQERIKLTGLKLYAAGLKWYQVFARMWITMSIKRTETKIYDYETQLKGIAIMKEKGLWK